ncbi:MAG: leucine--tRNA ligase [Candidatus Paceibacterota bacterium]|jgi:leucyl-tRNA synthetase
MENYNPQQIEPKWQKYWEENRSNEAQEEGKDGKPKFFVLDMFPYPSGYGLHVGHFKGYVSTDVMARAKRLMGFNVLYPMGWDAFGLPAENYAIKTGIHPEITTNENIQKIKSQMKMAGLSYDWSREINTTDQGYYKWTQWIFLKLFEKGLAYEAVMPINWCPSCKTGLANEEVVAGKCERCGAEVTKKDLRQWVLKITAYADRLLEDLEGLDWPEKIMEMQKNWIGRSTGAEIKFKVKDSDQEITVFTTRPDTLFGCTYLVLAPENPLIEKFRSSISNYGDVQKYVEASRQKMERDRISEVKDKTGVKIEGLIAINPVNGREIPIWAADYVLMHYGTGAVMAVPAHDTRDFEFAQKYGLEIIEVVRCREKECVLPFEEEGVLVSSDQFNGISSETAKEKIVEWLSKKEAAQKTVHYKLRDWLFSRQRYWGEPIPVVHCQNCGVVAIPESELPLKLPEVEKYQPTGTGESPLAGIESWVNVKCPKCGGPAKRETNTMPQWAGSSWYYLRYIDPRNNEALAQKDKEKYWMPVDLYVGGAEHAVLHLLYSRFWHKFLFDLGVVSTKEPFSKLRSIGLVLAEGGQKMSKSKGNVISSDSIIKEFGADALRVYELFMGPFDQAIAWSTQGVKGVHKFLDRVYNLVLENGQKEKSGLEIERAVHQLNKRVGEDINKMKFNTAVSAFMEFINFASENKAGLGKDSLERMLILLSPFAPHLAEELWQKLGHNESIFKASWPLYDPELAKEEKINLIVQINGKMRDKIEVVPGISEEEAKSLALSSDKIKGWLKGQEPKKVIFVEGRLVNIVL